VRLAWASRYDVVGPGQQRVEARSGSGEPEIAFLSREEGAARVLIHAGFAFPKLHQPGLRVPPLDPVRLPLSRTVRSTFRTSKNSARGSHQAGPRTALRSDQKAATEQGRSASCGARAWQKNSCQLDGASGR